MELEDMTKKICHRSINTQYGGTNCIGINCMACHFINCLFGYECLDLREVD